MIQVCLSSVYLSFFIWILISTLLFFIALRYSKGEIKRILVLTLIVNLIMFFTLVLLLAMSSGMC
jgi:ABC-type transport system involved in cytochrome c biogenesis permease subunit